LTTGHGAKDWADARRDVAPFLEQRRDVDLIAAQTFAGLLQDETARD